MMSSKVRALVQKLEGAARACGYADGSNSMARFDEYDAKELKKPDDELQAVRADLHSELDK